MEHLLARGLRGLQPVQALELIAVLAVQAHDRARGVDPPQVGLGVVPQAGQQAIGARVAGGRGVEEHLGVAHLPLAIGVEHLLQVAHPHVVGDHREVGAPEALEGQRQVRPAPARALSGSKRSSISRRRARSRSTSALRSRRSARRIAAREALAGLGVHPHPEQRRRGLREDLREPHGALDVVAGHGVRAGRRSRGRPWPRAGPGPRPRRPPPAPPAADSARPAGPRPPRRRGCWRRARGCCPAAARASNSSSRPGSQANGSFSTSAAPKSGGSSPPPSSAKPARAAPAASRPIRRARRGTQVRVAGRE